jgi:hypothetical protein
MLQPEDCRPHEFSTFIRPPPGAEAMVRDDDTPNPFGPEPWPLPLPLEDIRTPVPPQDLSAVLAELSAQVEAWRVVCADPRVPLDVRWLCGRCADSVAEIIREHRQTDVSELAPESSR